MFGALLALDAAAAVHIVANDAQTVGGSTTLGATNDAAQAFTTGACPPASRSTRYLSASIAPASQARIRPRRCAPGSATGTVLATLTGQTGFSGLTEPTSSTYPELSPPANTKLAASTTCWVVLEGGSNVQWRYTNSDDKDDDTVGGATSIGNSRRS